MTMLTTMPPRATAPRLRGWGPVGIGAIVVILAGALVAPLVSAALVLVWAHLSRTPYEALGFRRPRNWPATIVGGIALGVGLKLLLKTIVMPLLGAPDRNAAFQYLVGDTGALPGMLAMVIVGAGIAEEIFFRGYMFERLSGLLGSSRPALAGIVLLSSALFAIAHYPGQGLPGVEQAAIVGAVFGVIFARWKQIWMLMFAHAAFDVTAVLLIYKDWETPVAHVIFR